MHVSVDSAFFQSGRVRRLLFWYVAMLMAVCEALFVLTEWVGLDFAPRYMVWMVPAVLPVSLAAIALWLEGDRVARHESPAWTQWAFIGAVMFGVWAGVYFLSGRMTDPARVRFLPVFIESQIPFRPNYSLLYLLLYPIFLLPFFTVRDRVAMQRLVAADLLMLATCSAAFLTVPVAFDRPPLPPGPWPLGTWILSLVQGNDPTWNCLPSEHCAAAMVAALACWEANRKVGVFAMVATLAIGVSTLYTKQHYLVDVLAGYGLSISIHAALRWARSFEPAATSATSADQPRA